MARRPEYFYWHKGEPPRNLSPHFTTWEFSCPCSSRICTEQKISRELIEKLEKVRAELGAPIKITSGYRCPEYQETLRQRGYETASGVSQHELGNAADCRAADVSKLAAICAQHFRAIGHANTFVHVDTRADKERRWSYVKRT